MAAVSVRSILWPSRIGVKPDCTMVSASAGLKPPSGPTKSAAPAADSLMLPSVAVPCGSRATRVSEADCICRNQAIKSTGG